MKTLLRLSVIALLVAMIGFCVFGFVATFEPMPTRDRIIWRTVYGMVGAACTFGLVRPLRCEFQHWRKRRRGPSRFLALGLGAIVMVSTLTGCVGRRHNGPYYYSVEPGVTYLSEDQAIAFAKETMLKEGYDLSVWQLKRSDQGRRNPDKFINRFSLDPNQVRVLFSDGKKYREVAVNLRDGRVTSAMFFGM